jgi:O-antigen ligase
VIQVAVPRTGAARSAVVSQGGWVVVGGIVGVVAAYLAVHGFWYVVLAMLLLVPAFVAFQRHPLTGVAIWLAVTPLVAATESVAIRQLFWMVHRTLPLGVLLLVLGGAASRAAPRKLARLGLPELFMFAYVGASTVSIVLASSGAAAQFVLLYDRVIVPMCLYLIVRLLEPTSHDLRWLAPVALFVLAIEVPVGIMSIAIPGALPAIWLVDAERATGTFGDPDTFGTVMLLCGLVLLHAGSTSTHRGVRLGSLFAFIVAMMMVFLTFSRANWVAGLIGLAAAVWIYRARIAALTVAAPLVLVALLAFGVLQGPLSFAQERLQSSQARESAFARLPVGLAALRMFDERPLAGWGYGTFDRYSRPYFSGVANLASAEKEHASHNLFLTISAEQGLIGIVCFLAPIALWARRSFAAYGWMPMSERQMLAGLWVVVGAFFWVNNFSVMKSSYGLGVWWLTLGLVAAMVDRFQPPRRLGAIGPEVRP